MTIRSLLPALLLAVPAISAIAQVAPRELMPAGEISSPVEYRPQPFDVLGYEATVDLTRAPARQMSGVCTMVVRWVEDPVSGPARFHLRSLTVDSIRFDGIPSQATAVETPASATFHYSVTPPSTVRKGDTSRIEIHYSGTMTGESWGGVQSSGGTLYAMGVGFSNNYVSSTQHWLPCYDHPSDKATFRARFLVRDDRSVASNGLLTTERLDDSTMGFDWQHDIPCATYLYTFAVDQYVPVEFGDGTPPIVVYGRVRDTTRIRTTMRLLPRMVDLFERRFIPYPFEKVGYVTTPTGAMEHQTMISYNTPLAVSGDTVSSVAAHELAHQWFGDLVSPLDFRHTWLTESFATWSEALWAEELGGQARYLKTLQDNLNAYINGVSQSEGVFPLYDYPRASPSSNYPATIYTKGAVVVGMLRYELGDSIFFAAMQEYLRRYAYSTATTDSMRTVLEQTAGRSLGWFFDQWVTGRGWPQLVVSVAPLAENVWGARAEVHIVQTQPEGRGSYSNLPVEIGFVPPGNGATVYRMLRMNSRDERFVLDSLPPHRAITINQGPTVRTLLGVAGVSGASVEVAAADSGSVSFIVRPNPATSSTTLMVEKKGNGDCDGIEYEIFESTGRRIASASNDSCEFSIATRGFASGTYLFRFHYNGASYDVPVAIAR